MQKLLLIGSVGCGKTTFTQRVKGLDQNYSKTQTIYTEDGIYDTPGEYVDTWWSKPALQQASLEVDLIVFLHAANISMSKIPPVFSTFFVKPVIGVVTKIDLATREEIDHARSLLVEAGASEVYEVSSITGEGFDTLLPRLD